jgi:hypothetical protein
MQKVLNDMSATAEKEKDKTKQTKMETVVNAASGAYKTFFGSK